MPQLSTVLILGGTGEARQLAAELSGHPGLRVVSSLAGRVRHPLRPAGEVRVGGFGGADGLENWLRTNEVRAVIDATHPFADTMTASAAAATARLGLPFVVLSRPGWQQQPGDRWHWTDGLAEAAALLPSVGTRVFLTTGRRGLHLFAGLPELWFLSRSVDPPEPKSTLPQCLHVITDRGPYTVDGELALLREHAIDVLVTKDSGGAQTAAKLAAARQLDIPVVIVRRPALPAGVAVVTAADEAIRWLSAGIGAA